MTAPPAAADGSTLGIHDFHVPDIFDRQGLQAFIVMIGHASESLEMHTIKGRAGTQHRQGSHNFLIFDVPLPDLNPQIRDLPASSDSIRHLDHVIGSHFEILDRELHLTQEFLGGDSGNWFPLIVAWEEESGFTDYRPEMVVDYNLAVVHFRGRIPARTRLFTTVCLGLLQWQAMEKAIHQSRKTLEVTGGANLRVLRDNQKELADARHQLLTAIVSCDLRIGCYEFLDFDFADRIRRAWQLDSLESMAQWSLDACRERLQTLSDAQQEQGRRSLRIILAVLTVASALTAVLTVVDFSTSDSPLDTDSMARILTALAVVGLAVLVGIQLHRKGVD